MYKQQTAHYFWAHRSVLWCAVFFLTTGIGVLSCRKTEKSTSTSVQTTRSQVFEAAAAKEWYYATFKKSSDWASYNRSANGSQLPDWQHGRYTQTEASEIAEFPLVKAKPTILIPQDDSQQPGDRVRIAEATQLRVIFIKPNTGPITVRLLTFVPDLNYLNAKGFDLSGIHLHDADNDFTGRVYITTWNGTAVSAWVMRKGKFLKRMNVALHHAPTPQANECGTLYTLFQQDCIENWVGENLASKDCGDWYPLDQWFVPEPCDGDGNSDPCSSDMNSPSCQCEMYGTCGGSTSPAAQDCMADFEAHKYDMSNSSQVVSELVSEGTEPIDNITKWKKPKWRCLKNLTWGLYSHEEGQVELIDAATNTWQWKNLEHKNITMEGFSIGGSVTPDNGDGTPSFTAGTPNILYAGMSVSFNVTYSPICNCPGIGAIASYSISYTSNATFNAKP